MTILIDIPGCERGFGSKAQTPEILYARSIYAKQRGIVKAEKEGLVHSLNMLWEEGNSTQPILSHLWGTDMGYRFK
jgi:hypothetical protein